jgi:hypothetical protein
VGVQSGLLPWPVDWPMRAVRHCYENSLNERDPDVAATNKAVWLLAKSLNSKDGFPKFVVKRAHYPLWRDDQIGFHRVNGRRCETFLAKERLDRVCDEFVVDSSVFRRLIELKVVNQGAYTSAPPIEGSISRWWHCENTLLEAGRSSVKAMGKSHGARPVPQGSTKTRFQSISHDLEFDHRGEGGRETEGSYISSLT